MGSQFTERYRLNTFDFDRTGNVKSTSIMNMLQDISTKHFVNAIKEAYTGPVGLWVIVEWDVTFENLPKEPCELLVTTEPIYFRKFIAYRKYLIQNHQGEIMGKGLSKWAYLDLENRKNATIPSDFNSIFKVDSKAEKPGRLSIDSSEMTKLKDMTFTSCDSDLDVNQHVNNVVYLRWAMDALCATESGNALRASIQGIKIIYKKEVFEGQPILVETQIDKKNKRTVHQLYNQDGGLCVEIELQFE